MKGFQCFISLRNDHKYLTKKTLKLFPGTSFFYEKEVVQKGIR